MKAVDRIRVLHHRDRAESFISAMKFLADDLATYKHAVVLLAVHASISFADAVLIACLGQRSRDQDHTAAIRDLRALCRTRRIDEKGIAHFSWLLQRKTDFSYGDHPRYGHTDVQSAMLNAERFQTWVYRTFGEVKV